MWMREAVARLRQEVSSGTSGTTRLRRENRSGQAGARVNEFGSGKWEDEAGEVLQLCKDEGLEGHRRVKPAVIQQ